MQVTTIALSGTHCLTSLSQIKNQLMGVEEDRLCKPDRPFVSGRIPLEYGQPFYLLAIFLAVTVSACHGLTTCCLTYLLASWLYNENEMSTNPLLKSPLGAIGYMCYAWGTTYIVGMCLEIPIPEFSPVTDLAALP